jgi:hypothetical protein
MNKPEFEQLVRNHLLIYLLKNAGELGGKSYRVIKSAKDLLACSDQNRQEDAGDSLHDRFALARCELFKSHRTETSGRCPRWFITACSSARRHIVCPQSIRW